MKKKLMRNYIITQSLKWLIVTSQLKKTKQNKTKQRKYRIGVVLKQKMKKILDVANSTWVSREMPLMLRF